MLTPTLYAQDYVYEVDADTGEYVTEDETYDEANGEAYHEGYDEVFEEFEEIIDNSPFFNFGCWFCWFLSCDIFYD